MPTGVHDSAFTPTTLPASFWRRQQGHALLEHRSCFDLQRLHALQEQLGAALVEEDLSLLQRT